ncbi:MAG: tetratricopeptide repeat protein [Hydrogenibacillus sp.]|nr:tetratricopeptide repeat protein [Hydrogenibacillus sp.]
MQRPQAIGVFPGAAGFFLLPEVAGAEALLRRLLYGEMPEPWPEAWRFLQAALSGEPEEVVWSLIPDTPEGRFNRFVLNPEEKTLHAAEAVADGDMRRLLQAVAWRLQFPVDPPSHEGTEGEVRAFLLATHAYAAMASHDWPKALSLLYEAARSVHACSPVFAARLYAERAAMLQSLAVQPVSGTGGASGDAEALRAAEAVQSPIDGYRTALELLAPTAMHDVRGEIWLELGSALQAEAGGQKSKLLEAVRCYHEALKVLRRDRHPEAFALAHMNLAVAYLSMPMHEERHALRAAMAVQSLREALRHFTKETHPDLWASATINLANAIQHVKSSHIEDNLWEAVALYEDVLGLPEVQRDPVRRARVLANQGNALAHLGAFSRAVPRLTEAKRTFEAYGDREAAETLAETLGEIARRRSEAQQEVQ